MTLYKLIKMVQCDRMARLDKLLLSVIIMGSCQDIIAGEDVKNLPDNFQINFASRFPNAGDLNVQDELLFGFELKYFFKHFEPHHLYVSGGYLTDLESAGGAVNILYIDLGSQYDVPNMWSKRNYIEYSIGISYIREDYAFELLDRAVTNSYSDSGFKASFGYGFDFMQDAGTKISIVQYDASMAIGLDFYYQF